MSGFDEIEMREAARGVRGVTYLKRSRTYVARIKDGETQRYLGTFKTVAEASAAFQAEYAKQHGPQHSPSNDPVVRTGFKLEVEADASDWRRRLIKGCAALVETQSVARDGMSIRAFFKAMQEEQPAALGKATEQDVHSVMICTERQDFYQTWYTERGAQGATRIVFGLPPWLVEQPGKLIYRPASKEETERLQEQFEPHELKAWLLDLIVRKVGEMALVGDRMTMRDFREVCIADNPELVAAAHVNAFSELVKDEANQEWFGLWRIEKRPEAHGTADPSPWMVFTRRAQAA